MNSPPTSTPAGRRGGASGSVIALLALLLVGLAATGRAQDAGTAADQFSATVPIDATADSVVTAREMARLDGQRRALEEVVEGLGGPGAPDRLGKLGDQAITDLVASFSVANERMSAVRYLADYTFHFRPRAVRHLMDDAGIALTATPGGGAATASPTTAATASTTAPADNAKPVVVLPVYLAGAQATLWDDANPWREAWNQQRAAPGATPLVVPLGDAGDVAAIDATRARAGDAEALAAEARRNGGDEALVALAVPHGPATQPTGIDVTVRDYRAGQLVGTHSAAVAAAPEENAAALLRRAAATTAADIENGWRDVPPAAGAQEGNLVATLPIAGLDDWVRARGRLAAVPQIRGVSLVALSRQQATVAIDYAGSLDQLKAGLAAISLDLVQDDKLWRLARNAPGSAP